MAGNLVCECTCKSSKISKINIQCNERVVVLVYRVKKRGTCLSLLLTASQARRHVVGNRERRMHCLCQASTLTASAASGGMPVMTTSSSGSGVMLLFELDGGGRDVKPAAAKPLNYSITEGC